MALLKADTVKAKSSNSAACSYLDPSGVSAADVTTHNCVMPL